MWPTTSHPESRDWPASYALGFRWWIQEALWRGGSPVFAAGSGWQECLELLLLVSLHPVAMHLVAIVSPDFFSLTKMTFIAVAIFSKMASSTLSVSGKESKVSFVYHSRASELFLWIRTPSLSPRVQRELQESFSPKDLPVETLGHSSLFHHPEMDSVSRREGLWVWEEGADDCKRKSLYQMQEGLWESFSGGSFLDQEPKPKNVRRL